MSKAEQIRQLQESIRVGSFCKKWWKQLSKEIKLAHISEYQRIQVLVKICEGLLQESWDIAVDEIDYKFIYDSINEKLTVLLRDTIEKGQNHGE